MKFKEFYDQENDDPADNPAMSNNNSLRKGKSLRHQKSTFGINTKDDGSKFLKSKGYAPNGQPIDGEKQIEPQPQTTQAPPPDINSDFMQRLMKAKQGQ